MRISKNELLILIVLAMGLVLSFFALNSHAQSDGLLHVYFLNVGQGDAELIQTPDNKQILIDGGPGSTILERLGEVMPFNDRSIDMLILTHPHADHVAGLIEVLKRYDVDQIIESYLPYDTAEYAEWNSLKNEAEVTQAQAGQIVDLGNEAKITILHPYGSAPKGSRVKNPHDYVVVIRLDYGNESVMLTGDIEDEVEAELIINGASLSAQFLKVGHHGSKTSTSTKFLNAVNPQIAFIEVGANNRYGHPHPTIIERLENFGIKYYRTDRDGSSDLQLDGQNYLIRSF